MRLLLSFWLMLVIIFSTNALVAGPHKLPEGLELKHEGVKYIAFTLEEFQQIGLVYVEANRLTALEGKYQLKLSLFEDNEDAWYERLAGCKESLTVREHHTDYLLLSLEDERDLRSKDKKLRIAERVVWVSLAVILGGFNVYQGVKLADQ